MASVPDAFAGYLADRCQRLEAAIDSFVAIEDLLSYGPGETIITRSTETRLIGWLAEGIVKRIGHLNLLKKSIVLDFYGNREWIATETLLDFWNTNDFVAVTDCRVVLYDSHDLDTGAPPDILLSIAYKQMRDRLIQDMDRKMSRLKVRERVIGKLYGMRLKMANRDVPVTLKDMADLCQTNPSSVGKVFVELEEKGLIERGYGNYLIGDQQLLLKTLLQGTESEFNP